MDKQIKDAYYDPKTGFGSAQQIYRKLKARGFDVKLKDVKDVIDNQLSKQVFKQAQIRKDQFSHIQSPSKGNNQQMDLLDMTKYSKWNKGYKWIMNCVDVYSRKLVSVPMKSKELKDVYPAYEKCMRVFGTPKNLNTDLEPAVMSNKFQTMLREKNITHYANDPELKRNNAIVERMNRTVREKLAKYFYSRDTKEWVDVIDDIVENINNSVNRNIKTTPDDIWENKSKPAMRKYRYVSEIKVGDYVRVLKKYDIFAKKTELKDWSKNVYLVVERMGNRFKVKNDKGNEVEKMGYELQKVDKDKVQTFEGEKKKQGKEFKKNEEVRRTERRVRKEGVEVNKDVGPLKLRVRPEKPPAIPKPKRVVDTDKEKEPTYDIEKFIDDKRGFWLVKWQGYPESASTWESKKGLKNQLSKKVYDDLVKDFKSRN